MVLEVQVEEVMEVEVEGRCLAVLWSGEAPRRLLYTRPRVSSLAAPTFAGSSFSC